MQVLSFAVGRENGSAKVDHGGGVRVSLWGIVLYRLRKYLS